MTKIKPLYDNSQVRETLTKHPIIADLVNKDLSSLYKENFIIFPQQLAQSKDLDSDNYIFQSRNGNTWACNVVGVLSNGTDELRINSRFSNKETHEDFFLRYMLQKVLNYNVIDNKLSSSNEMSYYDLLVFLFPHYLNEALLKGVYKKYVKKKYNDANIKGPIDVARHIRKNIPFLGKVSYHTREFSYDNNVTELIRHTIEKIYNEYEFLLNRNEYTKENVRTIKQVTDTYSRLDRFDVLQSNILNPVKHGYFEEYSALQRLCIQILSEEKAGFGNNDEQVHGIIIDVAWLWEEYIGKVTEWKHYGRRSDLLTMQLFEEPKTSPRYPDFVCNNIPIDTKYKKNIDKRNDYNQITTYIHIMQSLKGGFLQPTDKFEENGYSTIGLLNGYGGEVFTYKFFIPQTAEDYPIFIERISRIEDDLKGEWV